MQNYEYSESHAGSESASWINQYGPLTCCMLIRHNRHSNFISVVVVQIREISLALEEFRQQFELLRASRHIPPAQEMLLSHMGDRAQQMLQQLSPGYSSPWRVGNAYSPQATAAVDTTGDGRANALVRGVDQNGDGIPDSLQGGAMMGGGMMGGGYGNSPGYVSQGIGGVMDPGYSSPYQNMSRGYPGNQNRLINQMGHRGGGYAPHATAAVDTTGDGRANAVVRGVDRNGDGIPDSLQGGAMMMGGGMMGGGMGYRGGGYAPQATAAVDTTGDGRANSLVIGVDRNHDGIPDALQGGWQRGY